jgi:hypothetical protein
MSQREEEGAISAAADAGEGGVFRKCSGPRSVKCTD